MKKYTALKERAGKYKDILEQVINYREAWGKELKKFILEGVGNVLKQTGVEAKVEVEGQFENLQTISIYLGKNVSGIAETFEGGARRSIIKDMGSLSFSQIFNGKVQVWMTFPLIEGLMKPQPPKMIGIFTPPEFNEDLILSTFDDFFKELINWENYDDDVPSAQLNKIGFGVQAQKKES
ncbi:MAG: hypothetical protein V3V00_08300 [Saprospiraceae bacterium]